MGRVWAEGMVRGYDPYHDPYNLYDPYDPYDPYAPYGSRVWAEVWPKARYPYCVRVTVASCPSCIEA